MALIVSPNLTVDRTVRIARLVPGSVQRPERAVVTAGAKGVNVARVLAAFGDRARLVGYVPSGDRGLVDRLFGAEPLDLVGVEVDGELRVATIYLEDDGRVTVLNEPGPDVDDAAWTALERTVRDALAGGNDHVVACSGSLPPGAPIDGYGRISAIAHEQGAEVVVDAGRDVLAATLPFHPDVVAPNLSEAEAALGASGGEAVDELGDDVADRAEEAARSLVEAGARAAVVTAGAAGAAVVTAEAAAWFPGVEIVVVNPIGAGDSFVAGFIRARERGAAMLDAVAQGLGTATASCEDALAGGVDPERASELAERIGAGRVDVREARS
ncbi:MAG: PfkB family carbohydrate kinase [Nitriliruptoraceae bacterium]